MVDRKGRPVGFFNGFSFISCSSTWKTPKKQKGEFKNRFAILWRKNP